MKHFLLTRFNLKFSGWTTSRDGGQILDQKWLEHRFQLFEQYCLPSVKNQTEQNFIWFVFFDTDTPAEFMARIDAIASSYSNFKPCFICSSFELAGYLQQKINASLDETDEYIITTRMDNDDAIHKDFISTIQSLFLPQHETVIDLQSGYQLGIADNKTDIRQKTSLFNPFLSVVECSRNFTTVLSKQHRDWQSAKSIICFIDKPLWIEVVHENNKLNAMTKKSLMIKQINTADFGLHSAINTSMPLPKRLQHNLHYRLTRILENTLCFLRRNKRIR